ncbi:MAG: enoyl-CoA hydratase/isomerase family protein [Chloroflexota bacterium]
MAIDVSRDHHVATVTLNRPEALNAFNSEELAALVQAFSWLRSEPGIRCVILTGAGEKAFAAGADIKQMAGLDEQGGHEFGELGHAAANAIERFPQPVIAAVNGYAFGGGCELALACDLRICSENAVFGQPEVKLGIPPGWGGSQRLPRAVGPGMAAELILTGRNVRADEALRIGLVNAVHPLPDLLPKARELADAIAANSPCAVRAAKAAMSRSFAGNPATGLDTELRLFAAAFATADQKEGMQAFIDKRKPEFA